MSYSESSDSSDDDLPEINIKSPPSRSKGKGSSAAAWKGKGRVPESPPLSLHAHVTGVMHCIIKYYKQMRPTAALALLRTESCHKCLALPAHLTLALQYNRAMVQSSVVVCSPSIQYL